MMEAICSLFELFNNPLLLLKAPFPLLGMRYKESVTLSARALLNLPYFFKTPLYSQPILSAFAR